MPPVFDPRKSKVDGLAFLGLSLARYSEKGHPDSVTHQEAYDLNDVLDRDYECIFSTNDDGWLVGGGEPGPPTSYKLAAKDSAHVEIMRIGTYRPDWGGIEEKDVIEAIESGKILIPQIEVLPTAVVANGDRPPELEIRFDMEPRTPDEVTAMLDNTESSLPINWQLRFIHNQLFKYFKFPSRFCPGAFHSTILRKAEFRSPDLRTKYFALCDEAISKWRKEGPKPLNEGGWGPDGKQLEVVPSHTSGIWLFVDRENITHFFPPNFLPPYDAAKRQIIKEFLMEEWDEKTLTWKPLGQMEALKKQQEEEIMSLQRELAMVKEKETSSSSGAAVGAGQLVAANGVKMPQFKTPDINLDKLADDVEEGLAPFQKVADQVMDEIDKTLTKAGI